MRSSRVLTFQFKRSCCSSSFACAMSSSSPCFSSRTISRSCGISAAGCWSCTGARLSSKVRPKRSSPSRSTRIPALCCPLSRPSTNPSGRGGGAAALAEAREKLNLAGHGFFHVARLDVTEAAHLFGQARDLDRERMVVVVEPHRDLAQDLLVVRNQQPLLSSLGGAAENIQWRAAHPAQPCQELEQLEHPSAEDSLARDASARIAAREHRRRQMKFEAQLALELSAQFLLERAVGIEPRHFVFVLVGHELEQAVRNSIAESRAAGRARRFRCCNPRHDIAVPLRISCVLIVGEKCGPMPDQRVQLLR